MAKKTNATVNSEPVAVQQVEALGTVTVVHSGRVNLRSSPKMEPGNIIDTAATGDTFTALDTFEENGHKWYHLEGDKYIRADKRLTQIT